jgi:hypothetical protein
LKHFASPRFWQAYRQLPPNVQQLADGCFALLKSNARHPSLHLKKVGRFWSARVGIHYRAIAVEDGDGLTWVWIGHHKVYDQFLSHR